MKAIAKKSLLGSLLILTTSAGFANGGGFALPAPNYPALQSSAFNGFYLGAGVGRDTSRFNLINTQAIAGTTTATNVNGSGSGALGTVFAGYGQTFNRFYLGGEINANGSTLTQNTQATVVGGGLVNIAQAQFKINRNFGASVLPGLLITDNTLLYARLGYTNGHLVLNGNASSSAGFSAAVSNSSNLNGFRAGLGIAAAISRNVDLRLDYSHINYSSLNFNFGATPNNGSFSIGPQTDQIEFDISYNFS